MGYYFLPHWVFGFYRSILGWHMEVDLGYKGSPKSVSSSISRYFLVSELGAWSHIKTYPGQCNPQLVPWKGSKSLIIFCSCPLRGSARAVSMDRAPSRTPRWPLQPFTMRLLHMVFLFLHKNVIQSPRAYPLGTQWNIRGLGFSLSSTWYHTEI